LASGREVTFGTWEGHASRQAFYSFDEKRDIIGVHGYVKRNPDDWMDDHIMSLGFTYNGCPGRELLDEERKYFIREGIEGFVTEVETLENTHPLIFVFIIALGTGMCLICTNCFLKHRGSIRRKLCGKRAKSANLEEV